MSLPKSLKIILIFVIKVVVAVIAFLTIGAAAIALNLFIVFAQARNLLPVYILYGMTALEYAIFVTDVVGFGYFLLVEAIRFMREVTSLL